MPEKGERSYGSHIKINLTARQLSFYEGDKLFNTYPVGVGKSSTPTPTGDYTVIEKVLHPGGALGTRWMGLSIPNGNYGIHGTNNPSSIGGYVSNGCIRMYNQDVEQLFPRVKIGTPVEIFWSYEKMHHEGVKNKPKAGSNIHIVQPGESLWQIAQKYGKTTAQIIQANNIENPDLIYPGQRINIP